MNQQTIALYDKDPYQTRFEAVVLTCQKVNTEDGTDLFLVTLDQTLFFPEQGGQTPDTGILGGQKVLDVQIQNGLITHRLSGPLTPGSKVEGEIDWEHRFSNMQNHSGEHIFSGLVHKKYGYDNVGFHLSDHEVTMDFSGMLTVDQIREIEMEANRAIVKNLPVTVSYPTPEEEKAISYRSKKEVEGPLRLVTIEGVDVCACCAPHVRRTGEIGLLKVISHMKNKSGTRVFILSGFRALAAFQRDQDILTRAANTLTTSRENIPERIERFMKETTSARMEISSLRMELFRNKMKEIPDTQRDVFLFADQGSDMQVIRRCVNELTAVHPGTCGIFVRDGRGGFSYIIGSRKGDARKAAALLRDRLSAKGGGSQQMVQGAVQDTDEESILLLLRSEEL